MADTHFLLAEVHRQVLATFESHQQTDTDFAGHQIEEFSVPEPGVLRLKFRGVTALWSDSPHFVEISVKAVPE